MKVSQLDHLSLPCHMSLLLADSRLLVLTLPADLGGLLPRMWDDRRSLHSVGRQHLPALFADDVASKPGPPMYPSRALKVVCLSGRHRPRTCC